MRGRGFLPGLMAAGVALAIGAQAWTYPESARRTKAACAACHVNPAGGAAITEAGKAFKADPKKAPDAKVEGATYVGDNKCRMCHAKQHKSWQETGHAKALDVLKTAPDSAVAKMAALLKIEVKGRASETAGCLSCHVTGFQLAGGYPAADSAKTAAVSTVTCEACHGPGSKHVGAPAAERKTTIYGGVTANMCTQCHTPATSPKFKFDEYKKRGVHVLKASG